MSGQGLDSFTRVPFWGDRPRTREDHRLLHHGPARLQTPPLDSLYLCIFGPLGDLNLATESHIELRGS